MTSGLKSVLMVLGTALPLLAAEWDTAYNLPGIDGNVWATLETSQGLVVAGAFSSVAGVSALSVALYHDGVWQEMDEGLQFGSVIYDLTLDDEGQVYACGTLSMEGTSALVARYGENGWEDLGLDFDDWRRAETLAWDDMGLWIGGNFREVNGMDATGLAIWNEGTVTVPVTLVNDSFSPVVREMLSTPNGMVVAGSFSGTSEVSANRLLRYSDGAWESLGTDPLDGSITSLDMYFGFLMVGGYFTQIGGVSQQGFAIYTGSTWTTPCISADTYVKEMAVSGSDIWIVGDDEHPLCHWNGISWEVMSIAGSYPVIHDLMAMENGDMLIGGSFVGVGDIPAASLARYSSGDIASYAMPGPNKGLQATGLSYMPRYVTHLVAEGGQVIMNASTNGANGQTLGQVPLWDDGEWTSLTEETVVDVATMNEDYLVIADINGVSRMDRETGVWTQMGVQSDISGVITELLFWGDKLMAAGYFTHTDEMGTENALVYWDESEMRWRGAGTGAGNAFVTAMAATDDRLYVGGSFSTIGGVSASGLASWDGESWTGYIREGEVAADAMLCVDGDLYIASSGFTASDDSRLDRMSENGQWMQLLSLDRGSIECMIDDGNGGLLLGGYFQDLNGSGADNLARWTPAEGLSAFGSADGEVLTIDRDGHTVYFGGSFRHLNGVPSYGFGICTLDDRSPVQDLQISYSQHGVHLSWNQGTDNLWRVYRYDSPWDEVGDLVTETSTPHWGGQREGALSSAFYRVTAVR